VGAGELSLDYNDFVGALTDELHGLVSLKRLNLTGNQFLGDINQVVDGLTSLRKSCLTPRFVNIAYFSPIPIVNVSIEAIILTENQFSGTIQSSIELLSNLGKLQFADHDHKKREDPFLILSFLERYEVTSNLLLGPFPNFLLNSTQLLCKKKRSSRMLFQLG
jgi:hypothetical protein